MASRVDQKVDFLNQHLFTKKKRIRKDELDHFCQLAELNEACAMELLRELENKYTKGNIMNPTGWLKSRATAYFIEGFKQHLNDTYFKDRPIDSMTMGTLRERLGAESTIFQLSKLQKKAAKEYIEEPNCYLYASMSLSSERA
uniref:Uncharacterized protein n=1 Tax=Zooxanthella nutricula TaxID=1333877 RepID=A0A6U6TTW0_9DINO|mmetsp:Transcript_81659/g.249426  ORF Transcript_81659/g.249426 Transcript_81659/m.249426 type:complete len:143 (+) Transcript_81659:73-501(+)